MPISSEVLKYSMYCTLSFIILYEHTLRLIAAMKASKERRERTFCDFDDRFDEQRVFGHALCDQQNALLHPQTLGQVATLAFLKQQSEK
jgi:hypothetical protein